MAKATGRGSDQFMLRFPDGMRERIAREAAANGRSMNAEIISRIETTLEDDTSVDELWSKVTSLEYMVRVLWEEHNHRAEYGGGDKV